MPQDSLSSTTQNIGNAGPLRLTCLDKSGAGNDIQIAFNPAYAKITVNAFAPIQHVNRALNGSLWVFSLSVNEPLTWNLAFQDIPSFDALTDAREQTQGYLSLLSFIRYTLEYHVSTAVIESPDGFIETMRLIGGIESLEEAGQQTRAQRAQRWGGTVTFTRAFS